MRLTWLFLLAGLAQGVDPLPGYGGWAGMGALGLVLAWIFYVHLPAKDRQLKEMVDGKDAAQREARQQFADSQRELIAYWQREQTRTWETLERWHTEAVDWLRQIHSGVREDVHATRNLHQEVRVRTKLADALASLKKPAIWTKSLDGVLESWNEHCEDLMGWTAAEVVGRNIYEHIIPADRKEEEEEVLKRISRGEPVGEYKTERRCRDGRLLKLTVYTNPRVDPNGKVTGATTVAREA